MQRRAFLASLAAAAFALDPERLLWRPGAKLISIPKPVRLLNITMGYFRRDYLSWSIHQNPEQWDNDGYGVTRLSVTHVVLTP